MTLAVMTQVEYAQEAVKKGSTAVGVSLSLPPVLSWSIFCLKHIVNKGLMGIFEQTLERIVKHIVTKNLGERCLLRRAGS